VPDKPKALKMGVVILLIRIKICTTLLMRLLPNNFHNLSNVGVTQLKTNLLNFIRTQLFSAQTSFNNIKHLEIQLRRSYSGKKLFLLLFTILAIAVLNMAWIGHLASDDKAYISAALGWLNEFPYVPDSHWAVRHTLNIPMAIIFRLFGEGEFQSVLVSLIYGIALLTILAFSVRRIASLNAAMIACLFIIFTPFFSETVTISGVDVVETFYVILSLLLYLFAIEHKGALTFMLAAGIAAGLAFLSRETSVGLIAAYGILFLFRPYTERWRYFVIGFGFVAILGVEMAYYAWAIDDPLLRFKIALSTFDIPDPITGTGNLVTNWWFAPIFSLLVNNEFGLTYWIAALIIFISSRKNKGLDHTISLNQIIFVFSVAAISWFLVVGYMLDLRALPRYFLVTTILVITVASLYGSFLVTQIRVRYLTLAIAFFVVVQITLIDLSNQQLLLPERTLTRLANSDKTSPIYTDPYTNWRSSYFLKWAGTSRDHVIITPPEQGAIFLYNPKGVAKGFATDYGQFDPKKYHPNTEWSLITIFRGNPTLTGSVLIKSGMEKLIEALGLNRIIWETEPVFLYRVE
jgi:hypothetical protein